jgi:hypothetical protein
MNTNEKPPVAIPCLTACLIFQLHPQRVVTTSGYGKTEIRHATFYTTTSVHRYLFCTFRRLVLHMEQQLQVGPLLPDVRLLCPLEYCSLMCGFGHMLFGCVSFYHVFTTIKIFLDIDFSACYSVFGGLLLLWIKKQE